MFLFLSRLVEWELVAEELRERSVDFPEIGLVKPEEILPFLEYKLAPVREWLEERFRKKESKAEKEKKLQNLSIPHFYT